MSDRIRREPNFPALYSVIGSYKDLANFYEGHLNIKTEDEIRKRIRYVTKNKLKQMNEIETLKWVLGESIVDEKNIDETENTSRRY